jgi:uncharacterized protein with FMN-binding domain
MRRTKTRRLMIPVAAATALAATALSACGGSTTATSAAAAAASTTTGYTDGTYTGDPVTIQWGDVQVQVTVQDGTIASVAFLSYPTDQRSQAINSQAAPQLAQEAVAAQSADVQVVSGATFTSQAFMQSLESALSQA